MLNFNARAALAKRRFADFIEYTKDDYIFNWHHKVLCAKLEGFAHRQIKKLMVFMPPQHGKSQLCTRHFPAYLLGIHPTSKICVCSYSATLAQSFNRDIQRIIDDNPYHDVFPKTLLNQSNVTTDAHGAYLRNADIFETLNYRGFVKTVGVGGSLTGTPIDVGIIDDPFKDREEAMSIRIRDKVWSWYTDVFKTRLHNDSQELLIMCMAGDTPVLMADGSHRVLKNIKIGDSIATYDDGRISTSKVLNWKNQGRNSLFGITTRSGIFVMANERHPFLIYKNGTTAWKRLKDLKLGDEIVRVMPNGAHTKESSVFMKDVHNQPNVKDIATPITANYGGQAAIGLIHPIQNQGASLGCDTDTELSQRNTTASFRNKEEDALYVENFQPLETPAHTGMENFASIIVTKQGKSEAFCVTTATSRLDTGKQNKHCYEPLNTYGITLDPVVEITPAGCEDVFDIQVDRTENFIANGLVSHNTRWDADDLAGRILKQESDWEVVIFQAIKEREIPGDPREIGEALWPEKHSLERILSIKNTSPFTFTSLYQQEPKPSSEALVFPEWDEYEEEPPFEPMMGLDFGFSNDPTAIPQVKTHNRDMWVRECLYKKGLTNSDLAELIEAIGLKRRRYVADSSEPKSIEDLRRKGFNIIPSVKGPDSVVAGINWIKDFKLHVHKDSHNLKNELFNYQWVMVGGVATNIPIDRNNHLIDGIRYTKVLHKKNSGVFHSSFHKV